MAIAIHVAYTKLFPVSGNTVINKNTATIAQVLNTSTELRIVEDASIPNSANNPTIKTYIELEADDDFVVYHLDNTMIVTYNMADINSA